MYMCVYGERTTLQTVRIICIVLTTFKNNLFHDGMYISVYTVCMQSVFESNMKQSPLKDQYYLFH